MWAERAGNPSFASTGTPSAEARMYALVVGIPMPSINETIMTRKSPIIGAIIGGAMCTKLSSMLTILTPTPVSEIEARMMPAVAQATQTSVMPLHPL